MLARTLSLLALCLFVPGLRADDEDAKAAQARLTEYLKGIEGADAARVTPLSGDGLAAMFPDHTHFAVLFPLYPVARIAPAPFNSSNVVAIPKKKDGKPVPITDAKGLEKFFKENAAPVKTDKDAEAALKAWLRMSAELNQDGFYKFTVKYDSASAVGDTITTAGNAPVDPQGGNKGEIKATLTFKAGKLTAADTKVNLTPGVRPRCQATKLLDPDPIVRGMAEDSIRMMGRAAKPYLDEQRAKANAQLREAIDRMWGRVVAEDR